MLRVGIRVLIAIVTLLGILLAVSGTIAYWQAWMVCITLLVVVSAVGVHFSRTDPDFLRRRLLFHEKEPVQKRVVRSYSVIFLAALLVPALDTRLGWSSVPAWVCVGAYVAFLAAYAFALWVFKTNRYASRVIDVQPEQRVVDTGPYAIVRHPLYASQLVLLPAVVLALGSWWAALMSASLVIPLVWRIRNEEAVLRRDLPGYQAYCEKVRYRLIPHVW